MVCVCPRLDRSDAVYRDSQYFGRDEEDAQEMEDSILGANGLGGLEASARDAVRTIMDQTGIESLDDVQGAIRQGALRVSGRGTCRPGYG